MTNPTQLHEKVLVALILAAALSWPIPFSLWEKTHSTPQVFGTRIESQLYGSVMRLSRETISIRTDTVSEYRIAAKAQVFRNGKAVPLESVKPDDIVTITLNADKTVAVIQVR